MSDTKVEGQLSSTAWIEEVFFVDCPHCEETIELGAGLVWSEPIDWDCPQCFRTFTVKRAE